MLLKGTDGATTKTEMKTSINYHTLITIVSISFWIVEPSKNISRKQPSDSFTTIDGNYDNKDKYMIDNSAGTESNLRNTQLNGIQPFNCSLPHKVIEKIHSLM